MSHRFSPEPCGSRITPIEHHERPLDRDTFDDIHAVLDRERTRAGQLGSAFSLVVFSLEKNPDGYTFASLVMWTLLCRKDRYSDIGWFDDRHIGVVMPGTTPGDAARFAAEVSDTLPRAVRIGYAVFGYPSPRFGEYEEYIRTSERGDSRVRPFPSPEGQPVLVKACV